MEYTHVYEPDIDRDYKSPLYMDELTAALYRLNPTLPDDAISDALFKLQNFENGELVQKNAVFMDYLQNGIPVRYTDKGGERSAVSLTMLTRTVRAVWSDGKDKNLKERGRRNPSCLL